MLKSALPLELSDKELREADPWRFLKQPDTMMTETASFSSEGKAVCWVPDEREGYVIGERIQTNEDMAVVSVGGEEMSMKESDLQEVNPPKFDKVSNMADLTYLNEGSILHNLRQRYYSWLIYTYSALFCVVINPYKPLPIYEEGVVRAYRGKKRSEMPPHVFVVADEAYKDMLENREDQSILITGESGAGKTVNTKRVIKYYAIIASSQQKSRDSSVKKTLEEQVLQANPVLESFGNAKTIRNDNSSRFGKFIRIHFNPSGKLSGADIKTYLLEKSRVIRQAAGERSYHIFYQLMSGGIKGLKEKCGLTEPIQYYSFISQGETVIDGVNDADEMRNTDAAFDILDFSAEEKNNIYSLVAAVMHFGTMQFKQRSRDEQAEEEGTSTGATTAKLLGLVAEELYGGLLKPQMKVGHDEHVTKGQTKDQVYYAIGALAKAIYNRLFIWMVKKINTTMATKLQKKFFIGILDIAGFEIFVLNSFEQLCINLTNEKLQQFFNHFMFVLEQEEYKREKIAWDFIDFGLDLQPCIDLIEKPMGVFAILEEESMFPKATDQTFCDKLMDNHLGKSANMIRPKLPKGDEPESHFGVVHYAGVVNYNVANWLEKNKDPINDTVAELFAKSQGNVLLAELFADKVPGTKASEGGKHHKASAFQTVSALYKEQLNNLMNTLHKTAPHFVRCIIPNEEKKAGVIDASLVLNQLKCNGVLEGIRICRKGYPNKLLYKDFKQRYYILAPNAVKSGSRDKEASSAVLKALGWNEEEYKLGETKVFFRAGSLGKLEELREERLSRVIVLVQAHVRGKQAREHFQKMKAEWNAMRKIQRNVRIYLDCKNEKWWWVYVRVFNRIAKYGKEDEKKRLEEEKRKREEEERKRIEEEQRKAEEERLKNERKMEEQRLQEEKRKAAEMEKENQLIELQNRLKELEKEIKTVKNSLEMEQERYSTLKMENAKKDSKCNTLEDKIDELENKLKKLVAELAAKEQQNSQLREELTRLQALVEKINREKKSSQETADRTADELQKTEEKFAQLNKSKNKLEQELDDLEQQLDREKRNKSDVDKSRRKVESSLKDAQCIVDELEARSSENQSLLQMKENDLAKLHSKDEEQQAIISKLVKKLKEAESRIEELESEQEEDRQRLSKVERKRADLAQDLEDQAERLDEAVQSAAAQNALNKKKDAELANVRQALSEQALQHEAALEAVKKKQMNVNYEMNERMNELEKVKAKLSKDNANRVAEVSNLALELESVKRSKTQLDKVTKILNGQLADANAKLDESIRINTDTKQQENRLLMENRKLEQDVDELEKQCKEHNHVKQRLQRQIAEFQEHEATSGSDVMGGRKLQSAVLELEEMKTALEESADEKEHLKKQLIKMTGDYNALRDTIQLHGLSEDDEEIKHLKSKMQAKLLEAQDTIETLQVKVHKLENQKAKLQTTLDDSAAEIERATTASRVAERKQKTLEKEVLELKGKLADIANQLEATHRELAYQSAELLRTKAKSDNDDDVIEGLKRKIVQLEENIKELNAALDGDSRSAVETQRMMKRLEREAEEYRAALEQVESELEQEASKCARKDAELRHMISEAERRLVEKDEEFEVTRRSHQHALDSMQASLEAESKAKLEAVKSKKKLESGISSLERAVDQANKELVDAKQNWKKQQHLAMELEQNLEKEQELNRDVQERCASSERRCQILTRELEDLQSQLRISEQNKRKAESELAELSGKMADLQAQTASLNQSKRKLETEASTLQADIEENQKKVMSLLEKLRQAETHIAQLNEEFKAKQSSLQNEENARHLLEKQIKELQIRLDEAEAKAGSGGAKMIAKLENQVRELQSELEASQRHLSVAQKDNRKLERQVKDLVAELDGLKSTHSNFTDMIDKLNDKVKLYKKQIEEAEAVADMNMSKFKKVQCELEEAETRAEEAETTMSKLKSMNRHQGSTTTSTVSRIRHFRRA